MIEHPRSAQLRISTCARSTCPRSRQPVVQRSARSIGRPSPICSGTCASNRRRSDLCDLLLVRAHSGIPGTRLRPCSIACTDSCCGGARRLCRGPEERARAAGEVQRDHLGAPDRGGSSAPSRRGRDFERDACKALAIKAGAALQNPRSREYRELDADGERQPLFHPGVRVRREDGHFSATPSTGRIAMRATAVIMTWLSLGRYSDRSARGRR